MAGELQRRSEQTGFLTNAAYETTNGAQRLGSFPLL